VDVPAKKNHSPANLGFLSPPRLGHYNVVRALKVNKCKHRILLPLLANRTTTLKAMSLRFAHCNDPDLVLPEPVPQVAQGLPPEPPELPKFEPLHIPCRTGYPTLPPTIGTNDPLAIFSLLLTEELVQEFADYSNEFVTFKKSRKYMDPELFPYHRDGPSITKSDIYAYLGCLILMGCHPETNKTSY
jgi:hypothetical protein